MQNKKGKKEGSLWQKEGKNGKDIKKRETYREERKRKGMVNHQSFTVFKNR